MLNQFFGEEGSKRISKWVAISLMVLSAFLLVSTIAGLKNLPNIDKQIYPQSTIMVSGSGEAYAIPDIATFSFSVTEVGDTVKQAQEKSDAKINKALVSVKAVGIADKDIKTTNYNVYPKYEWSQKPCPQIVGTNSAVYSCPTGKNVLVGYEVSQSIMLKVRDMAKAADLVTKVGAIGVENISGLEFSVDNQDKFVAEARAQAISDAKAKAQELAKQLGVHLGQIMSYNEDGNNLDYYDVAGKGGQMALAAPVVELPQGQNKITSNVTITYEIK